VRRRRRASRLGRARLGDVTRDRRHCRGDPLRPADVQGSAGPQLTQPLDRLRALGFSEADAATLADHFLDAERRGKRSHGLARIDWLETLPDVDPAARPQRIAAEPGYERWDGAGALGYLTLAAICDAVLADSPTHARVVVALRCFPTGSLGYWVRRLAEGGLAAVLTATSPKRLASPDGGPPLAGTNPIAIGVPSSDGAPLVADVSMGRVTHGDVLAGLAPPDELVPFGGDRAFKAFALAVGVEALVGALAGDEYGALLLVARPEHDSVPSLRALAGSVRLPGDGPRCG
jgi:LDH2 family malate/lactate/ureidoglycolate dehydrogenase